MNRRLALAAAPLVLLAACSSGGSEEKKPQPITVKGTVTLVGLVGSMYGDSQEIVDYDTVGASDEAEDGDSCAGDGGYSDLKGGAQVTITDDAGKTLGLGTLTPGALTPTDHNCAFNFEVKDVDTSAKFFKIGVSHRDGPQYTLDDLKSGPALTIGN